MLAKIVLFCLAQILLFQYISAQCIPAPYGYPYAEAPFPAPCASYVPAAANGGGFAVRSSSPIAVTGLSISSDNAYDGQLSVCGAVPFLGAVALDGCLPTGGAGAVKYGCGNGEVAMVSENAAAYPGPYAYGPAPYEAAAPGSGCGCNRGCSGPFY